MKSALLVSLLILALATSASTTNNDDSCDIGTYPAATLLLPYFEVDTLERKFDTVFTVTNVSQFPQIAHVTIWTDWSFPVLTFNLFLTGYDVQSISLYDVIVNGIVAPTNPNLTAGGTSSKTIPGTVSAANSANPNLSTVGCEQLPGFLAQPVRSALESALISGLYRSPGFSSGCGTSAVGSPAASHRTTTTAVGFVTIDVTSRCSPALATDPGYYANEILFDNVLTGDYAALDKSAGNNFAGGNPLVHIRAVPEGGPAGAFPASNAKATPFPYTFYSRFINGQMIDGVPVLPNLDRRQPLGSTFAARWIQDAAGSYVTRFKIWREGPSGPVSCANAPSNRALNITEIVRFDEHENPSVYNGGQIVTTVPSLVTFPAASQTKTTSINYPPRDSPTGDAAGWMYLNLDNTGSLAQPSLTGRRPSQNWVVVSMTSAGSAAGLFAVESNALSLGNGCSPAAAPSIAFGGTKLIGPAGGALVCPPGFNIPPGAQPCVIGKPPYTGTNANP